LQNNNIVIPEASAASCPGSPLNATAKEIPDDSASRVSGMTRRKSHATRFAGV